MESDDAAISLMRPEYTMGGSTGFNSAWLQTPQTENPQVEWGQPKNTPCNGAGIERGEQMQFG